MKDNRLKVEIAQRTPGDLGRGPCFHADHAKVENPVHSHPFFNRLRSSKLIRFYALRTGWESNSRWPEDHNSSRDHPNRPPWHLSSFRALYQGTLPAVTATRKPSACAFQEFLESCLFCPAGGDLDLIGG
jgi:hypothetical protein